MLEVMQAAFGLLVFIAFAWALSENRRDVVWRTIAAGVALQIILALLLLKIPLSHTVFQWIGDALSVLQAATQAGTSFVFGYLGGAALPWASRLLNSNR